MSLQNKNNLFMKNFKPLFLSFTVFFLAITLLSGQNNLSINGKLLNNKEFDNVELQLAYGRNATKYVSKPLQADGTFNLQALIPQPDIYRLAFDKQNAVLLPLSPNDKIELELDANNLQQILSVKGSPSLIFVKKLTDLIFEKQAYLDSVNKALQNDPNQLYFSDFGQKFNLYHQTNQDVDNYIQKLYSNSNELQETINKYSDKGEIQTKFADAFIKSAMEILNALDENYTPFANYLSNVQDYYDFSDDSKGKNVNFDKKLNDYLSLLSTRHQRAESDFKTMVIEAKKIISYYQANASDKDFNNKKNKNNFCNRIIALLAQSENMKANSDKYIEEATTSNLLAKDLISDAQKQVSAIVKQYQEMYNAGDKQRNDKMVKLLQDNKGDLAILMFIDTYVGKEQNAVFYQDIINTLAKNYPSNPLVIQKVKELEAEKGPLALGSVAPDMEYENPDGKLMKLSDLRGKVVLIDFWASWCRPCRMENPNVVKLYEKYRSKGFDVYSVSLDRDKTSWVNAIKSDNLSWESHVSDLKYWSSAGAKLYGVSSIPSTFLLDKEGRIIGKNLRGAALESKLREIFGE